MAESQPNRCHRTFFCCLFHFIRIRFFLYTRVQAHGFLLSFKMVRSSYKVSQLFVFERFDDANHDRPFYRTFNVSDCITV